MNHLSVIARAAGSSQSNPATSTELSEDARAFLQRRVASVGAVLAAIFGAFLLFRIIGTAVVEPSHIAESVPLWAPVPYLGASVASFVVLWLACRGRPRSVAVIRGLESSCLLVGCTAVGLMAFHVPYGIRPDYIVLLALGMVVIARAVYVPSSGRRTMVMVGGMGVPLLVSLFFLHLYGHDPAHYTAQASGVMRESPMAWAARWTVLDAMWWGSFLVLAGAASHVIYGLRAEVRDARKLGQYTLVEKVGEGGMGTVYRASHAMLRRPAAVKLLPPDRFSPESAARFEREVQLTAALTHPNTVRVFDYGRTPDGVFYYAMELLDGANLAEVVTAGGALPAGRVVHVLDHLVGALAEAHGVGLIHRDIKPANILLTEQGGVPDVVKVVDFGLVKAITEDASSDQATVQAITQVDAIAGTPHYMAPEAIAAPGKIDARADLYAVGAVGYFLLTGHDVFTGRNAVEIFAHHLHTRPAPPSARVPVPAELEAIILACLEKAPDDRPPDARTLQDQLRRLRGVHPWTEDDARGWWSQHRAGVRSRRVRNPVATGTTLAVDLDVRAVAGAIARP